MRVRAEEALAGTALAAAVTMNTFNSLELSIYRLGRSMVMSTNAIPVPGGVGPVTTALLLRHTVEAAEKLNSSSA